jgi:F-type H+-transporting ATPase subunit delta
VAQDESVADILENPQVSPAQAVDLLSAVIGEEVDEHFNGFLSVLSENRRLPLLPEITALFMRLKQDAEKRLHVRAVSAIPLEESQVTRICDALAARFELEIELDAEIDENILGGAVLYAGDQVIDGSLRGRLDKLVNSLAR